MQPAIGTVSVPAGQTFQSSTRQVDFATWVRQKGSSAGRTFQSSTRQVDFATVPAGGGEGPGQEVSILYEADRLCNYDGDLVPVALFVVSILYEADRLCNTWFRAVDSWS